MKRIIDPDDHMNFESEELLRWANAMGTALSRIQKILYKCSHCLNNVRSAVRGRKTELGREHKADITKRVLTALGQALDPFEKDLDKSYELAFRGLDDNRAIISLKGHEHHKNVPHKGMLLDDELLMNREQAKRVEGLAHEVMKIQNLAIPSEGVIAALAQRGWNDVQFGTAIADYLDAVFKAPAEGRGSPTITQKREALKWFFEWKARLDPKPDGSGAFDVDSMSDRDLKGIQRQIVRAMLEEESPRRLTENNDDEEFELQPPDGAREG